MIYLDYNATAPLREEVADAMLDALRLGGNPSSVHRAGRRARRLIEEARLAVAALVGAAPENLIFTSGGSEANNQALAMAAAGPILVSAVEHDSVLAAAPGAVRLPVDGAGRVDLERAALLIERHRPRRVSVMLVNNETGVIQPVAEIARLARATGALVHCDAVQAVGRMEVDLAALGVDLLTLSAHKLGGPPGVGALALRPGLDVPPLIRGGGQERRRRAGTENLGGIAGFGRAAAVLASGWSAEVERVRTLRDRLEGHLLRAAPEALILGRGAPRVGNTTCVAMPGVSSETQLIAFDLEGVCVSAGAACSSGKVGPSHVPRAMGIDDDLAGAAIRVSLGHGTMAADIERFLAVWLGLYRRTRVRRQERRLSA